MARGAGGRAASERCDEAWRRRKGDNPTGDHHELKNYNDHDGIVNPSGNDNKRFK